MCSYNSFSLAVFLSMVFLVFAYDSQNFRNLNEQRISAPPHFSKSALMARYIVNNANWTSIATVSVRNSTKNYPFVNVVSTSDGPIDHGSGVAYVFLTPLDFTAQDLKSDNRATMLMTLAQGKYCNDKGYDPMDPRCARVILAGRIVKILPNDPEYETAKKGFFVRHEWLSHMPPNHHFYLAKMNVEEIAVLATFGGPANVTPHEYYNANKNELDAYTRFYKK